MICFAEQIKQHHARSAELGDGETTRTAREIWTFKRVVTADDPNWLLDDVEVAG